MKLVRCLGLLVSFLAPAASAASWTYVTPAGARGLAVVNAGDRLLLGTAQGLYESFDQGQTWSRVEGMADTTRVAQIVVDPHTDGHWYVRDSAVVKFETRDFGTNWSPLWSNFGILPVTHPTENLMIKWGSEPYGYDTSDSGLNWFHNSMIGLNTFVSAVALPPPRHFGAVTYPNGASSLPKSFRVYDSAPIAPVPTPAGNFYIPQLHPRRELSNQPFWHLQSPWLASYAGTVDFVTGEITTFPVVDGELFRVFDDPANADTVIGLHRPLDNGACGAACVRYDLVSFTEGDTQWRARGTFDVLGSEEASLVHPTLLAGDGARLWVSDPTVGARISDDGGYTWKVSSTGLREAQVNAVAIDPRDPQILLAGRNGQTLRRSIDGGSTWADVAGQVPSDVRAITRSPVDADHLVATAGGGLYRSVDAGATWQRVPTTLQPAADTSGWDAIVWCAANDTHLMAVAAGSLYRSTDGGIGWALVSEGTSGDGFVLETARFSPGRTYFMSDSTWSTDDCGVTTTELVDVGPVVVDPNDDRHLVAATRPSTGDAYFRVSTDGGTTWTDTENRAGDAKHSPVTGWIDACNGERYTTGKLSTMFGTETGLLPEAPAIEHPSSTLRSYDSQCNGEQSYNVVSTSAGGLWVSVAEFGDRIFDDGFDAVD